MTTFFSPAKYQFPAHLLNVGLLGLIGASDKAEPAYNKPFYNPETKTHFELYAPDFDDSKRSGSVKLYGGISYEAAMKMAAKRRYKGLSGRLSIEKSRETHEFLAKSLRPASPA